MGLVLQRVVGADLSITDGDDHERRAKRRERLQADRAGRLDQQNPLQALALTALRQRDVGERTHARELAVALSKQGERSPSVVAYRLPRGCGGAGGEQRRLQAGQDNIYKPAAQPSS